MYPGIDGFLGSRASLMVDFVLVAIVSVVPVLAWSIWLVRVRKNYVLHRRVQLTLAVALLLVITLFEIDVRFVSGWRPRAVASQYYASLDSDGYFWDVVFRSLLRFDYVPSWVARILALHIIFAASTVVLWTTVSGFALKHFGNPPRPGKYGLAHRCLGWLTAVDTVFTAVTGVAFYWLAFVS